MKKKMKVLARKTSLLEKQLRIKKINKIKFFRIKMSQHLFNLKQKNEDNYREIKFIYLDGF